VHITSARTHVVWDNSLTPLAEISLGTEVTVDLENS
jgi:hypothetical protein